MWFCPQCANLLFIQESNDGKNQFYCKTCPYVVEIRRTQKDRTYLKRKEVDDVLGGDDAWKNVDSAPATCPKCENNRAYFMQIQTRSADEPMTTFYRCTQCSHQWREQ